MGVLVLGLGAIGRAIYDTLKASPETVAAADPFVTPCDDNTLTIDILANPKQIRHYNYVINTVPIHDPERLAPLLVACIKYGVHYLDTNEDREVGRFIRMIGGSQKDILFAPHCGLAPGLINVLGGYLLREYNPETLDLRVGALTRLVDNQYLYTPTWSTAGMINQCLNDFEIVENGESKIYSSMFSREANDGFGHFHRFYHDFYLDGVHYECFPTSGGLGTIAELAAKHDAKSVMYRTIRLHRHAEALRSLIHGCGFDRQKIVAYLDMHREMNAEDMIYVIARAEHADPARRHTVVAKTSCSIYRGKMMTAIQKCTAGGVAAVLDLHTRGKISPSGGFLHQHDIDWTQFAASRYINEIVFDITFH